MYFSWTLKNLVNNITKKEKKRSIIMPVAFLSNLYYLFRLFFVQFRTEFLSTARYISFSFFSNEIMQLLLKATESSVEQFFSVLFTEALRLKIKNRRFTANFLSACINRQAVTVHMNKSLAFFLKAAIFCLLDYLLKK